MDSSLINRERCIKLKERTVYNRTAINVDNNINNAFVAVFMATGKADRQQTMNL